MHLKFLTLSIFLILINELSPAQNVLKPFPQHVEYYSGVIKPSDVSQQQMDDSVGSFYKKWKERYLHDDAGNGQYYIWVEGTVDKNVCVSEGQGYGMVIVALMAGYDTDAKKIYDGLYSYYRAHPSKRNPYLMAWAQTETFEDIDGSSATDGDLDIAYSLLLADAQWGSNGNVNYNEAARLMIGAIKSQEINHETFSILLSDAVEMQSSDYYDTRSSDFMPAHFKIFATVTGDTFWDKTVDKNYSLFNFLQEEYSPDAGLVPDFIQNVNSRPEVARSHYLESKHDGEYNYNACRVPWRIATDFIISGDKRSKKFTEKINTWIRATTLDNPDNISAGYTLDGDDMKNRNYEEMSFIASFTVAAMISRTNQAWLNKLWNYMLSFNTDQFEYYGNTIKMIAMIILSGNYWVPKTF